MTDLLDRRIYTFWEPKNQIPGYLRLCLRTWKKFLPSYELIVLDHSNLFDHIPSHELNLHALKNYKLGVQKDAIEIAVLKNNGGIFMDVDTIVLDDVESVMNKLGDKDMMIFAHHLAVMAATKNTPIHREWLKIIRKPLSPLEENKNNAIKDQWDYLGNSIFSDLLKNGFGNSVRILNKINYAFTPETIYFSRKGLNYDQYLRFWFNTDMGFENVFYENQSVIALHNSWTPEWYKKLTEEEVLEDDCLLSKTLKFITSENINNRRRKSISLKKRLSIFLNTVIKNRGISKPELGALEYHSQRFPV
jgi:hypothetical protein